MRYFSGRRRSSSWITASDSRSRSASGAGVGAVSNAIASTSSDRATPLRDRSRPQRDPRGHAEEPVAHQVATGAASPPCAPGPGTWPGRRPRRRAGSRRSLPANAQHHRPMPCQDGLEGRLVAAGREPLEQFPLAQPGDAPGGEDPLDPPDHAPNCLPAIARPSLAYLPRSRYCTREGRWIHFFMRRGETYGLRLVWVVGYPGVNRTRKNGK